DRGVGAFDVRRRARGRARAPCRPGHARDVPPRGATPLRRVRLALERARGGRQGSDAALRYVSTSGAAPAVDFHTALFRGIAPDGSLYVPEHLPRLPDAYLNSLHECSFHDIATQVLAPFVDPLEP